MLVIILETICYLSPYLFEFFLDHFLIGFGLVAKKPAAAYRIITVAVDIDDRVKAVVYAHIDYFLYSVEPCGVDRVIRSVTYLGKI